jgi:hypothetical protein
MTSHGPAGPRKARAPRKRQWPEPGDQLTGGCRRTCVRNLRLPPDGTARGRLAAEIEVEPSSHARGHRDLRRRHLRRRRVLWLRRRDWGIDCFRRFRAGSHAPRLRARRCGKQARVPPVLLNSASRDEAQVRSILADRPRFTWVSVNSNRGSHSGPHVNACGDPDEAARAVARHGGLPLRLVSFTNADPPQRDSGFGFRGRWNGTRKVVGRAAIDCEQGKAIVLAAGVRPPASSR